MKSKTMMTALLAATLAAANLTAAHAEPQGSSFEVGTGAMVTSGQQEDVNVLVRVDFQGSRSEVGKTEWIMAKIKANAGIGTNGSGAEVSYADIEFESMGAQHNIDERNYIGFSMGTIDYKRNLAIGNDETITVSIAGINGRSAAVHSAGVEFYVQSAVNMIGAGYSMSSKGVETQGMGVNIQHEMGFIFGNRFTVAAGTDLTLLSSNLSKKACKPLATESDPNGSNTSVCTFDKGKNGASSRALDDLYIKTVLKLNESLSLFGEMHNQSYSITSRSHTNQEDGAAARQYFIGISGQF